MQQVVPRHWLRSEPSGADSVEHLHPWPCPLSFPHLHPQAIEAAFKNETIGLVTREQFVEKRQTIEERLKEEEKRRRHEAEEEALRVRRFVRGGVARGCPGLPTGEAAPAAGDVGRKWWQAGRQAPAEMAGLPSLLCRLGSVPASMYGFAASR